MVMIFANMHRMFFTWLALGFVLLTAACGRSGDDQVAAWPAGDSSYVFAEPDARVALPSELDEISGLALLSDGMLAAVQDEEGELFVIDPSSGAVIDQRAFGEAGDYEAVDVAEGRLLVLRSDGQVTWFSDWSGPQLQGQIFELDIPGRCDAEGMRYDAEERRLLVSCKDEPGPGIEVEKAIYAFSLEGAKLQEQPAYTIDTRAFNASVPDHPINQAVRSMLSDKVDLSGFRPSEIAFHPLTGDLWVLSAVRESIVIVDRTGQVTGYWILPHELLNQPEGMVFLPNGDVFIASEAGNQDHAVLLRYNYRGSAGGGTE